MNNDRYFFPSKRKKINVLIGSLIFIPTVSHVFKAQLPDLAMDHNELLPFQILVIFIFGIGRSIVLRVVHIFFSPYPLNLSIQNFDHKSKEAFKSTKMWFEMMG